jgi:uncharacterized protein YjbJ (UPF0337 family)
VLDAGRYEEPRHGRGRTRDGTEEAKGTIKEATGKLVGDEMLGAKGNIQKNLVKVQAKVADVKQDVKKSAI